MSTSGITLKDSFGRNGRVSQRTGTADREGEITGGTDSMTPVRERRGKEEKEAGRQTTHKTFPQ